MKIGSSSARAAAAFVAAFGGAPGFAQTAPGAPQGSRWHLDGATNRCVLTRSLQGTPGAVTFILRTIPGSARYDVILAGEGARQDVRRRGSDTRLAFIGSDAVFQVEAAPIDLPGNLRRGIAIGPLPAAFVTEFAKASALRLTDGQGRELGSWTVPSGRRAAEALAFCETEKQVEWGADRSGFGAAAVPPRPATDPRTWLTIRDFGLAHSLSPASYTAVFRLVLDTEGKPMDCKLLEFAGNVDIEDHFCRALVRSARYEPARNAGGNPVRSVAVHVLSFRMDTNIRIDP